jgi:hypothetical protein
LGLLGPLCIHGIYAFEGLELALRLAVRLFTILEEYPSQMRVGHLVESILGIPALYERFTPNT